MPRGMNSNFNRDIWGHQGYTARATTSLRADRYATTSYRRYFYNYQLVEVTVSPQTEFEIDKTVRTRNKDDIKQHFVR